MMDNETVIKKLQAELGDDFLLKYLDWQTICKENTLSEQFIREFQDIVDWDNICKYQKLSNKFINEFHLNIDKDNIWLDKSTKEKKQAVIDTGKYECYDDYFVAFKAIRNDRSSLFNRQNIYVAGKTYASWCDTTDLDRSFGLSAWTYEGAQDYGGDRAIIVKVKIFYKDIGRIKRNNHKIRCFKLTVLE